MGRSGMGKPGEGGLLVLIHFSNACEPLSAVLARVGEGMGTLDANGA